MKPELWPKVVTKGELAPAEGEWLHTNGAGAYSMSTVALMHTRRFHGLLIASLDPPLERHVIVSHAETSVRTGKRIYHLSTHQFPDIAPTPGYRLLESFAQDPLPRWSYRLGKHLLERTLCLVRGENALVVRYIWRGRNEARLSVKPLLPMRPIHDLRSEQGGFLQKVAMRRGEVSVQPVRELPEVVFGHGGVFMGSPDWWRRFEYSEDMRRHAHYQEDMWTPGTFEIPLLPDQPSYITAALTALPEGKPEELMEDVERALLAVDPGTSHSAPVRALCVSAEQYRAAQCRRPAVLAGYPWLGVRSRDTLVSLPGLYLTQGLVEEAKAVLRTTLLYQEDSLLLASIPETSFPDREPSVDASLWLFEASRQLLKHVPAEDEFVASRLYPALKQIFHRVRRTPAELIWVDEQGLVITRSEHAPLTWMDSRSGGSIVTPRWGLAVEVQALWARGCETLALMASKLGDEALSRSAEEACLRTRRAFKARFWCHETNYPYDCIDETEGQATDAAIRPNALLALALDPECFDAWQATAIVEQARLRLLTPVGVRTLDPSDPAYIGYYEGGMEQRRAAYHQGVAWGYLLGAYARAALRLRPDDFELQMDIKDVILRAIESGPVLGQIAQVAAGDPPHQAGGCPAQAWSVAELLRTLWDELKL